MGVMGPEFLGMLEVEALEEEEEVSLFPKLNHSNFFVCGHGVNGRPQFVTQKLLGDFDNLRISSFSFCDF
ncbi:hypothetical protein TorRG33x02_043330 [Trema orientale]|uniref:Uncharacterized protein n=1 Tax=Trema orientale TaxID=63057 RepID=A0A2P5FQ41_TREOI|nr:hypothetical protein TorRG33x02_043330 [Trema orientale]